MPTARNCHQQHPSIYTHNERSGALGGNGHILIYSFASSLWNMKDWHGKTRNNHTCDLKQSQNRPGVPTPWCGADSRVDGHTGERGDRQVVRSTARQEPRLATDESSATRTKMNKNAVHWLFYIAWATAHNLILGSDCLSTKGYETNPDKSMIMEN